MLENENRKPKKGFGLNTKLVLIFILLSLLPISLVGLVVVSKTTRELENEAISRLESFSRAEAERINLVLSKISSSSKILADYATEFYRGPNYFYHPDYWSTDKLFQCPEGQWGNKASDASSVIVFNWQPLNEKVKYELTLAAALDFVFPSIKQENPDIDNLYIIGDKYSWYRFYPNSDPDPEKSGGFATDVLPPDLNKEGVDPVFWEDLDETRNPERLTKWTPPYLDVTGHGLMVSALSPVYDNGKMVALTGVDFTLQDITNRVLDIQLWKTGYAFMIDNQGRIISSPVRAQPDLGGEESVEISDLIAAAKQTANISLVRGYSLLDTDNPQLLQAIDIMTMGEDGLKTVNFRGIKKYVAFSPIENTGWSLGLVVPVNEVVASALTTRSFIFIVLTGVTFILIVLILFSSRLVTKPIKELTKGAAEISRGNLAYQIKIKTRDEMEQLAEGFNEMARKLRAYYATLEQKVKDRTRELALAKNRIEEEKNRIEAILVSIADGVFVIGLDKKLILMNPSVERISGFNQNDCLDKVYNQVFKFLREEDKKENNGFIEQALETGQLSVMANHTFLVRKDNSEMPVACSAAAIKNERGLTIGGVVVFRDITKEREMDRIKSEFVSLASHQLRTPVTIIKWGVEALLKQVEKKMNKSELEQMERIYRGSDRMIELVNDLLNVSRLESGRLVFKKEKVQFEELVGKVIDEYQPYLEKKKAKLVFEKPRKPLPQIEVDPEKIRQVIIILLDNALKYSPEGKEIKLTLGEREGEIVYSVQDQGVGIPQKQQEKIFTRFFRAENVSQKPGTGLGLYLAKGLVEAHNGKIWFESEENKGTTFFFTLPYKT